MTRTWLDSADKSFSFAEKVKERFEKRNLIEKREIFSVEDDVRTRIIQNNVYFNVILPTQPTTNRF